MEYARGGLDQNGDAKPESIKRQFYIRRRAGVEFEQSGAPVRQRLLPRVMPEDFYKRLAQWRVRGREPGLTVLVVIEIIVIFVVIPLSGMSMYQLHLGQLVVVPAIVVAAVALIAGGRRALVLTFLAAAIGFAADFSRFEWPSAFATAVFLFVFLASLSTLTGVVGATVFGGGRVTAHRIHGAIVVYLHFALIFTYLYAIVLFFAPGAFGETLVVTDASVGQKLLYFSFSTLTTAGYGDIVPVHPLARSLANLEGIVGQLYPATLLARIASLAFGARHE
jgi:hypothetical protein